MTLYYCLRMYEIQIRAKKFYVSSEPPKEFENNSFKVTVTRKGPGFYEATYLKHPIFTHYCVPKEVVDRLYPQYRAKMKKKRKQDVIEAILLDLYENRVQPSPPVKQLTLQEALEGG